MDELKVTFTVNVTLAGPAPEPEIVRDAIERALEDGVGAWAVSHGKTQVKTFEVTRIFPTKVTVWVIRTSTGDLIGDGAGTIYYPTQRSAAAKARFLGLSEGWKTEEVIAP